MDINMKIDEVVNEYINEKITEIELTLNKFGMTVKDASLEIRSFLYEENEDEINSFFNFGKGDGIKTFVNELPNFISEENYYNALNDYYNVAGKPHKSNESKINLDCLAEKKPLVNSSAGKLLSSIGYTPIYKDGEIEWK